MAKKDHLTEELNRHFGFGTFKGNQKAIIENVLAGQDYFREKLEVVLFTHGRRGDRHFTAYRADEESGGRDAEFQ